ncbi:DNA annealing helicase and endonuclease ZRANB3 [Anomaloglossus baeobatrachus]|uniref:DNA annealing helicase and endonuclease ZRANB3 n=1 Tax=Anomaloglossus baeobatrachus TaxID=238106 RepID=UPI003F50C2CA
MAKSRNKRRDSAQDEADKLSNLPEKLRERLLPFQREGVVFALQRQGRCMIADEMGLGKTLQAIAVAYCYREEWPLLIVVPSSLKYPWIEEMEKWIPELGPEDISVIENKTDVGRIPTCKVTVLGYGLLTADAKTLIDALFKQRFKVVLVDESHYMKSRNASRSKLLLPIVQKASRALLLTGTPALGRPEELFMQIDGLFPKRFGTWTEYAKKYCNAHVRYFGNRTQWDYRGASNLDDLHQRLSSIMIRRLKSEVLTQLPPKIRQRIPFDLPKDVAKEMNAGIEEWERLMRCPESASSDSGSPFIQVMGMITHMFKQTALAKAGAVKDYIKMMLENEKLKFLVFGHHLSMLQACTEAAIESKAKVTGSTLNGKKEKIQAEVDDKEKWDFLSFAKSWTPNEELEDINDQLFTHFEKEKQHDIRSFFSPRPEAEKKRKRLSGEEGVEVAGEIDDEAVEVVCATKVPSDDGEVVDVDALFPDEDFDQEAKRFRPSGSQTPKSTPKSMNGGKRKSWSGKPYSLFSSPKTRGVSEGALHTPPRPALSGKQWDCQACTYSNNSLLPYCEICESPRNKKGTEKQTPATSESCTQEEKENESQYDEDNELVACAPQEAPPTPQRDVEGDHVLSIQNNNLEAPPGEESAASEPDHCHSSTCFPVYDGLMFCASRHTDRVYLYSKDGATLNCNFIPLDIKLENWDDLPDAMQQKPNRSLILRFVREWRSLTAMKQRMIRKSGLIFSNAVLAAGELSRQHATHSSTKRYLTKEDVAAASLSKVQSSGGSVRLVSRERTSSVKEKVSPGTAAGPPTRSEDLKDAGPTADAEGGGYLQAVDSAGVPLCVYCQGPCPRSTPGNAAWDNRFCSRKCQDAFLIRSNQSYMRAQVFETEHGVCQQCCLNAHELYLSVRDAPPSHRKGLLESTWMAQLPIDQLNELIRSPTEGQFWQVDHIRPVYGGGGQCALDNLQTLCTVCHRERTAHQAKERSRSKKLSMASKYGSDITKFFTKV